MLNRVDLAVCLSDLKTCQRVFDQLCVERQVERTSEEAWNLASVVLFLFQDGHTDEADLLGAASAAAYFAMKSASEKANSRRGNPAKRHGAARPHRADA
jgi:hypothetical protein